MRSLLSGLAALSVLTWMTPSLATELDLKGGRSLAQGFVQDDGPTAAAAARFVEITERIMVSTERLLEVKNEIRARLNMKPLSPYAVLKKTTDYGELAHLFFNIYTKDGQLDTSVALDREDAIQIVNINLEGGRLLIGTVEGGLIVAERNWEKHEDDKKYLSEIEKIEKDVDGIFEAMGVASKPFVLKFRKHLGVKGYKIKYTIGQQFSGEAVGIKAYSSEASSFATAANEALAKMLQDPAAAGFLRVHDVSVEMEELK